MRAGTFVARRAPMAGWVARRGAGRCMDAGRCGEARLWHELPRFWPQDQPAILGHERASQPHWQMRYQLPQGADVRVYPRRWTRRQARIWVCRPWRRLVLSPRVLSPRRTPLIERVTQLCADRIYYTTHVAVCCTQEPRSILLASVVTRCVPSLAMTVHRPPSRLRHCHRSRRRWLPPGSSPATTAAA